MKEEKSLRDFERHLKGATKQTYVLRLYVTGATAASKRAIANLKKLCEEHLQGRYELEVIDIFQQPELARGEQIIAAPTLIRLLPPPLRRFIGDMSILDRVLVDIDLRKKEKA